ncbi:phosphotransferase [Mycolicibacterium thermoresistibile]
MGVPALDLLLGPEAPNVLGAAVAEYGCRLEELHAAEVVVEPTGAGVVAMYLAGLKRGDGERTTEFLGATTGTRIPAGATVVAGQYRGAPVEVGIWAWQRDPALPALLTASNPTLLARRFEDFGLSTAPALGIRLRTYRPASHAVLEVTDGRNRWFVKVVRPTAVAALRHRHTVVHGRVPVPPMLAWAADGLTVSQEGRGEPLRGLIFDGAALPSPDALAAVLDALPAELMSFPPQPSHLELVGYHAGVLRCAAADEPAVLHRLTDVVTILGSATAAPEERVPAHGDFYEGQLLIENGHVTTVLDIDTAGPGARSDEWATMLAHLSTLALERRGQHTARRYADVVRAHAERHVAADQLRHRTAAAILGLATAPFRVQQPAWPQRTVDRLELAISWVAPPR